MPLRSVPYLFLCTAMWCVCAPSSAVATAPPPLAVDVALTPAGDVALRDSAFDPEGPVGWRMRDRFRAFRFELLLDSGGAGQDDASVMEGVASLAHDRKCHGWIQATAPRRVAGEVRCPTRAIDALETRLRDAAAGSEDALALRRYASTKIRYHFPRFRVLTEPRYVGKTCFSSPPHACVASATTAKSQETALDFHTV